MKTNYKRRVIQSTLTTALLATSPVSAEVNLPRGPDIAPMAGSCPVGEFPQTNKAGPYNELCNVMEEGEICLAYIKQHFMSDGQIIPTFGSRARDKMSYCLEVLSDELLSQEED